MVINAQAEGRGTRITRSLSFSHSLPQTPSYSILSLYLCYPSFIDVKLIRRSCVRDTYGFAPSVGLFRSTITKIPSSPFPSSTPLREFCWNHWSDGFHTALSGSRVRRPRVFGRWSCRRYVVALLLHGGTVLPNLFFFLLRRAFCFRHAGGWDSIWDRKRCRR